MAGINQGTPETAIGEPIRLGSNDEFEIEQHPVSDRLIIRDTQNGKVAYVRKERGGEIGGDGVLIKALKESKPMADDGRTYDTIQQAEREASSWVFVPPGTYNESVEINTSGLTLRGSGYNTFVDGGSIGHAIRVSEANCHIQSLRVNADEAENNDGILIDDADNISVDSVVVVDGEMGMDSTGFNTTITNCRVIDSANRGIDLSSAGGPGRGSIVSNCIIERSDSYGINSSRSNAIIANNIVDSTGDDGIQCFTDNNIFVGNIVINASVTSIQTNGDNTIIANNRVVDIFDNGTGTLLDGNLTGAFN